MTDDCPLCSLKQRTHWYHQELQFVVLDCESCGGPMWVQRLHGACQGVVRRAARARCRRLFGPNVTFTGPHTAGDHYHEHVHGAARGDALDREAA